MSKQVIYTCNCCEKQVKKSGNEIPDGWISFNTMDGSSNLQVTRKSDLKGDVIMSHYNSIDFCSTECLIKKFK